MNQPKSVFDFLRARGEEFFSQVSSELMSNPQFIRAMQAAWKGKERIDDAVSQALRSMNVPTRAEFKKITARLDALELELAAARAASAPAAKPRNSRKPPARKPGRGTPAGG